MALELSGKADVGSLGVPFLTCQCQDETTIKVRRIVPELYSQTRRVLSAAPVAMRLPKGFQAMERMLSTLSSTKVRGAFHIAPFGKAKGSDPSNTRSTIERAILAVGGASGSVVVGVDLGPEGVEVSREALFCKALSGPQGSHPG